jgi:molybdopterin-biosynthesis enzyme MoeA-like protein
MTATAHLVTVGAMPSAGADGAEVAEALAAEGITLASRVFIEDDEAALERALGCDDALTVVLAGGGGSAGDSVRRVLARATGTRLVLNERVLAALQERYRRVDRPLPRRAERLALLPQGATVWVGDDGESGWALVTGTRAFAVLAREGSVRAMIEQHLSPFARVGERARDHARAHAANRRPQSRRRRGTARRLVGPGRRGDRLDHSRRQRGVGEIASARIHAG